MTALRTACDGLPYETQLSASGGEEPYSWEFKLANVPEFTLSTSGELKGTPVGAGVLPLSVRVTDAQNKSQESDLLLRVHAHCGIAYISGEAGLPQLHVTDVLRTRELVLPSASTPPAQAFDFKFSPDGTYLAFRAGADTTSASLYVLKMAGTQEQQLPFALPVLDYAWSQSGHELAVILQDGQDRYLSGLQVPGVAPAAPIDPGVLWPPQAITYRGDLQWIEDTAIIYQGQAVFGQNEPVGNEMPYITQRTAVGLSPARAIAQAQMSNGKMWASPTGLIAYESLDTAALPLIISISPVELNPSLTQDGAALFAQFPATLTMWWSSSRRHLAKVESDGTLAVFDIANDAQPLATSTTRCGQLLAWRTLADRERIVCVDDTASGCETDSSMPLLRVLDFYPNSNDLDERSVPSCVFTAAGASGAPRDLSRRHFVFDNGEAPTQLTIAETFGVKRYTANSTLPGERSYAISPDESRLMWQAGTRLWWTPLEEDHTTRELSHIPTPAAPDSEPERKLNAVEPCETVFLRSPERWCGAAALDERARWSPNSNWVLFKADTGTLWVADVSVADAPALVEPLSSSAATCSNGCIESFAFQP